MFSLLLSPQPSPLDDHMIVLLLSSLPHYCVFHPSQGVRLEEDPVLGTALSVSMNIVGCTSG